MFFFLFQNKIFQDGKRTIQKAISPPSSPRARSPTGSDYEDYDSNEDYKEYSDEDDVDYDDGDDDNDAPEVEAEEGRHSDRMPSPVPSKEQIASKWVLPTFPQIILFLLFQIIIMNEYSVLVYNCKKNKC